MKKILNFVLFLFLCSCDNNSDELIIGTCADNPPYESIKNAEIIGIDIDIIKEIAKTLNKKIKIKNMDFAMLIPALSTGNVDIVIAAISPTKERSKNIDFSEIYLTANIAVLFKSEDNISSSLDLKNKILGAQFGTTWGNIAHNLSSNVKELSSNLTLLEELNLGYVDALIIEEKQAKIFTKIYPHLKYFTIKESSNFAIALPKNSPMTKHVNDAINKMKNEKIIEKIQEEWLAKD
jgi:polar amino acid transport system substrate-binding protein